MCATCAVCDDAMCGTCAVCDDAMCGTCAVCVGSINHRCSKYLPSSTLFECMWLMVIVALFLRVHPSL